MSYLFVMDEAELRAIAARGESLEVEFKRVIDDDDLVSTVVCLANSRGGLLLVGVDDDGSIVGSAPRHGEQTDPARIAALVASKTVPPVSVSAEVLHVEGLEVLAVEVPNRRGLYSTSNGYYARRMIDVHGRPACQPMPPTDLVAMLATDGQRDLSAIPLHDASPHDIDPLEIERYRSSARRSGDQVLGDLSDDDLMRALGFRSPEGALTMAAVLMFGTEAAIARFVPTHEVAFQVLHNNEVRVNRIYRPPLVRAMDELQQSLSAYNPEEEVDLGLVRLGLPRFAPTALREAIANALVHRNYGLLGQVRVAIDQDDLSVSSPGTFPDGLHPGNLLVAVPQPRNPLLASAFHRAGLVERAARGVKRMYEAQLELGRPAPDYGRSTGSWVEVRLRGAPADTELAAFIAEGDQFQDLRIEYLQVLHEVRSESRISTDRAAELLQVTPGEARAKLNELVRRGLLEARGESRGRTYLLSASVHRRLGDAPGYVRTRGFDTIQHEQMVRQYVEKFGAITRRAAADLCSLDSGQASRLLRRMAADGKLELRGERRGAHYVLPGAPSDD